MSKSIDDSTYQGLVQAVSKGDIAAKKALHDWLEENGKVEPITGKLAREITCEINEQQYEESIAEVSVIIYMASKEGKNGVLYSMKHQGSLCREKIIKKLRNTGFTISGSFCGEDSISISW